MAKDLTKKLNDVRKLCERNLNIDFSKDHDKRQYRIILNELFQCFFDDKSVEMLNKNKSLKFLANDSLNNANSYYTTLRKDEKILEHESREISIPHSFNNYYNEGKKDKDGNNLVYNIPTYVKWLEIYTNSPHST